MMFTCDRKFKHINFVLAVWNCNTRYFSLLYKWYSLTTVLPHGLRQEGKSGTLEKKQQGTSHPDKKEKLGGALPSQPHVGKKREEEWASEIPEFLESHFLPLRQSWEGCWTSPLISREDCTLVAPSLHIHWIEAGAAGNLVKAGASLDNLGYADCWGCSELLAATQACPVFALCLLSVLFFTATQWGRYHHYSNCPEERLLVNQERSNEVLNTSISRSDGEGSFRSGRQWAEEAEGLDCMVWQKGGCPSWLLGFCLE